MIRDAVTLNGVDPDGNNVPDEILVHEDNYAVELIKCVDRRSYTYEVRTWHGEHEVETVEISDFEEAFGLFAAKANQYNKDYKDS